MLTDNLQRVLSRFLPIVAVVVTVALLAVSCNDVNFSGTQNGKAQMNVHLTDAPANYQEVNVDVQGLRIHYTPADNDTVSADTAEHGKWIDLPVEPMIVNLLELTNGVDTLLASAELDPGHYKNLRLILGDQNTVVVDSVTHDLKVPSGQQSGYKIKFKTDLEEGEEIDVVIDFDANRSVVKAGRSGLFILKPVLKAFTENGEETEVGSISGTVEPVEANPNVYAIMNGDTSSTQADTASGEFLIRGLEEGLYDLSIEPTNEQYSDTTLSDISVEAGEETSVGTVTLSENE